VQGDKEVDVLMILTIVIGFALSWLLVDLCGRI
jgi:hypothetical protein